MELRRHASITQSSLARANESVPLEAERATIDAQAAGCFSGSNYKPFFNSVTGPADKR